MPGSKNSAQIHAQYLAPWAVYRQAVSANDNLGSAASVTQVLDLSHLISAASSELWVTTERTAGSGTITVNLVRENEGSLTVVPYQVVAQQAGMDHKTEHRFTGILPGKYRVLVTGIVSSTWTIHTTAISKLAFASAGGGGGGGGTVDVPTVPFTWVSGTSVEVQAFSQGAGWLLNGNFEPFASSNFTSLVYTGTNFSNLQFIALSNVNVVNASSATAGGTLVVENCAMPGLALFNTLTTIDTLTIKTNSNLSSVTGFTGLTQCATLNILDNPQLVTLGGFTSLATADAVTITGNAALATVSAFSAAATVGVMTIKDNPSLTSLSGIVVMSPGATYDFRNNLLPQAEIDRLLAVAVASNFTGTIWLNGTGNAVPSDPGGLADVAALRGAGATVHVNGEINLQIRGGAGLGIGSGNVFGSDRHIAKGNVCFTTDGYNIYAIDTTDPDNPSVISGIGYNTGGGGGGGGGTYTGPTQITVAGFADTNANGVYNFVSANLSANAYGGVFKVAVYQNGAGYKFIVSPPSGGGGRCDILTAAATWDGTTLADNSAWVYVNYDPSPVVQNWRLFSNQSTPISPQPTISANAGDVGDAAWSGGGGGGGLTGSSVIASMTLVGNNIFVCYEAGFVETLDVTDPSVMVWIGHCDTGFSNELQCSAWAPVKDNVLYQNSPMPGLGDQGSIIAYDISDPTNVSVLARVRTPVGQGAGGLTIIGNTLWACNYFSHYDTGNQSVFYGLDITTPASMSIVITVDCTEDSTPNTQNGGFIGRPFEPWGMCKLGNFLYVLDDYIIQIWDVSTPLSPVHVDTIWNENNWSDTEGFCMDEAHGILIGAVSGYNGPANRGGSVIAFSVGGNGVPNFVTEVFPLSGGASRFGDPDTTRRLVYGSIGGIFNIVSY